MATNKYGYTDRPEAVDQLGVGSYYEALADYIENCEAPTTISIQGDWGTGKTTAIRYIEKVLAERPRIASVCLNVWPYSSFEHGGNVSAALLQDFCSLLSEVGIKDDKLAKARQMTERFFRMAAYVGMSFATNSDASPLLGKGGQPAGTMGSINEMKHFKDEIVKAIDSAADFDRLVVFVDDLDRLNPRVALEILEGLKNFIDCDKCVFVLAIDFDIVSQGVRMKYGDAFQADKGRKFFDKIIQLQFHLPVNAYDIKGYLQEEFLSPREDADRYESVILTLLGSNPRNIKRAFNLLKLHELILAGSGKKIAGEDKIELFVILLIQLHSKDLYFSMVQHTASGDEMRAFLRECETDAEYIEKIDESLNLGIFDDDTATPEVQRKLRFINREKFCENLKITSAITSSNEADEDGAGGGTGAAGDGAGKGAAGMKIGEYVRHQLGILISENKLSKEMVHNMQQKQWCEINLHLQYPFLKHRNPNRTRHEQIEVGGGQTVYWVKPVTIRDKEYYVCNQWYEPMRPYFEMWLETVK